MLLYLKYRETEDQTTKTQIYQITQQQLLDAVKYALSIGNPPPDCNASTPVVEYISHNMGECFDPETNYRLIFVWEKTDGDTKD